MIWSDLSISTNERQRNHVKQIFKTLDKHMQSHSRQQVVYCLQLARRTSNVTYTNNSLLQLSMHFTADNYNIPQG